MPPAALLPKDWVSEAARAGKNARRLIAWYCDAIHRVGTAVGIDLNQYSLKGELIIIS